MFDLHVAVISDVHGNRWALEAVLRDIKRREIAAIVNLGDVLYGPLDPSGTAQILVDMDIPTVLGNQDRILLDPPRGKERVPTLDYVLNVLTPEHIEWLKTFPMTLVVYDDFYLCHGSPDNDTKYLLADVTEAGVSLRSSDSLMKKLETVEQRIVLCGHDHVPRSVLLPDGRIIIDPGSVGLPAYDDALPFPHVMETGTPHARYCIVTRNEDGWWMEDIAVPYDWQAASDAALTHGRSDWAEWLRLGRA